MSSDFRAHRKHMFRMLLLHLLIVIIVPNYFALFGGVWDRILAFLAASLLFLFIDRRYFDYLYSTSIFVTYLVKEIIVSSLVVAWVVIQPKPKLDPGIIGIPLKANTPLELTVLSLAVTSTPGTIPVEMGRDPNGRFVLYLHALNVEDPDKLRASIQDGFERMILRVSKGASQ